MIEAKRTWIIAKPWPLTSVDMASMAGNVDVNKKSTMRSVVMGREFGAGELQTNCSNAIPLAKLLPLSLNVTDTFQGCYIT